MKFATARCSAFAECARCVAIVEHDHAEIAGGYFAVHTAEWSERGVGQAESIPFEVDDVADAHRELKSKGLKVGEIIETPGCRMFSVYDGEGNRFGVHQKQRAGKTAV
jgi:predicted enzyme related to lactoylglutathione lyase